MRSLAALALVSCSMLACSSRTEQITISVLTKPCSGSPDPTKGVDHYRVVISASDIPSPLGQNFAVGSPASIPSIPPGSSRQLTVYGYQGNPANGGSILAFGQSVPFDVPDVVGSPVSVSVVLRPTGQFSGVNTIAAEGTCAKLTEPRAGHTATLLQDGRVLFVGGFSINAAGGVTYTPDAEVFDPATFNTTAVTPMTISVNLNGQVIQTPTPRAFHSASALPDGTVFIAGGEEMTDGGLQNPITGMLYEPANGNWGVVGMQQSFSHQQAISDPNGRVLFLGGVSYSQGVASAVTIASFLDPSAQPLQTLVLPEVPFEATDFAASAIPNSDYVVTAGGELLDDGGWAGPLDGNGSYNLSFFESLVVDGGNGEGLLSDGGDAATVVLGGTVGNPPFALPVPVHGVVAATIGASLPSQFDVLFAGGFGNQDDSSAVQTVSVLNALADNSTFTTLSAADSLTLARGEICAAALQDGRTLLTGGEVQGTSLSNTELYQLDSAGNAHQVGGTGAAALKMLSPRVYHTCTVLQDGSVLIAGGLVESQTGTDKVLDSIEIYTPVPLSPM